jgi:hypothetical protein
MSQDQLPKIAAKTAAEVCKNFALVDEAKPLLRDNMTPKQFYDVLIEKGRFPDAIGFLATAVPMREATWWACRCVREVQPKPTPQAQAALQAAEKWVTNPSDQLRRGAKTAAEAAGLDTPAGSVAMSVFWSGGSLAAPELPAVHPDPHLGSKSVASAIMMAALQSEPDKIVDRFKRFLSLGLEVAKGTSKW